jgi:hypothetical protein
MANRATAVGPDTITQFQDLVFAINMSSSLWQTNCNGEKIEARVAERFSKSTHEIPLSSITLDQSRV